MGLPNPEERFKDVVLARRWPLDMEGGRPSAYCLEQLGLFEAGEISVSEMRDRVVRNASR
jgi:hypothetical protein